MSYGSSLYFYGPSKLHVSPWPDTQHDMSAQCEYCGARRWVSGAAIRTLYRCAYCGTAKPPSGSSSSQWITEAYRAAKN